ncbi:cysteine-rich CWC family protein [Spirosoma oryzicola]|uniref:cysteine-rich CWC family protein n=1 Tax=Spirosoma oryzicola TaxID=2898794 RepID=UPI001E354956|nr:cysteine-rich CWC family protein [Spirosoma oryzicola]UHG89885.1 cysteine-rich CWC family protein [Spirosoma oryzicola]
MSCPSSSKHEHIACPRCQRPFECRVGSINLCQCQSITLTETQQHYIRSLYEGCLCADCLCALRTDYNNQTHQEKVNQLVHGH